MHLGLFKRGARLWWVAVTTRVQYSTCIHLTLNHHTLLLRFHSTNTHPYIATPVLSPTTVTDLRPSLAYDDNHQISVIVSCVSLSIHLIIIHVMGAMPASCHSQGRPNIRIQYLT